MRFRRDDRSAAAARCLHHEWAMTIQQPPNDEMPPDQPIDDPNDDAPGDGTGSPEQRAPGADQAPVGAPRDEPDPEGA